MNSIKNIISNRELNRVFSRQVQACMVDGYDIEGALSEASWGNPHVVLVKSQRGKKDMIRVVELTDLIGSWHLSSKPELAHKKIVVTEYPTREFYERNKNDGKTILERKFYVVGGQWSNKKAWTENRALAEKLDKIHGNRQLHKGGVDTKRPLKLEGKTLETLVVLVRKHGHLCKSIGPKNIMNATLGKNYSYIRGAGAGSLRLNVTLKRGEKTQDVEIRMTNHHVPDYTLTSPRILAACEKRGEKRDHAIARLV